MSNGRLVKALPLMLLSFIVYIVFTGSVRLYDIVTGVIVAAVIGLITANVVVSNPLKAYSISRLRWLIQYVFHYFLVSEVKAHLDVIKRALSPRMPINPGIVRVPYRVVSDYAEALVACSITNTPGTVVVDLDKDKRMFYVHWIDVKTVDPEKARLEISSLFEKYAKNIFD